MAANDSNYSISRVTPSEVSSLTAGFAASFDTLGAESGVAQNLKSAITSCSKLASETSVKESHVVYCLVDSSTSLPVGFVKIGVKHLYLLNANNALVESDPVCVLDFYISSSCQRMGLGKVIFEAMVAGEVELGDGACATKNDIRDFAKKLAYDRPSPKMFPFLKKNYALRYYKKCVSCSLRFRSLGRRVCGFLVSHCMVGDIICSFCYY